MCSKNVFFTLGFWVGLPQNLAFDFSVQTLQGRVLVLSPVPVVPVSILRFMTPVKVLVPAQLTCVPLNARASCGY